MPSQYELARRDLMNLPAALLTAERMVASASNRCAIRERIEYRNWLMLTLGFDGVTAYEWQTLVEDVARLTHVPVNRLEEVLSKEPTKQ
jgi:hypothetical protein